MQIIMENSEIFILFFKYYLALKVFAFSGNSLFLKLIIFKKYYNFRINYFQDIIGEVFFIYFSIINFLLKSHPL
jgi:hypothetical protein